MNSYSTYPQKRASLGFGNLQVSTQEDPERAIQIDENEYTARPGNAHAHASFHSSLEAAAAANGGTSAGQGASGSAGETSTSQDFPGLSRPLTHPEQERLAHLDKLKFFLATAPSRWDSANGGGDYPGSDLQQQTDAAHSHPSLNRFLLPTQEYVSCVLWNGLYHITGTDIVRALVFRFEAFGRPVRNMKKFEEGIFSDLRNLKPGVDASLEEPKSPFLDLLFKYQCIRTQKKQKVFYWFSVPHDRLFLDALERDLKREKMGLEPTTVITGEPAMSFRYDPKRTLYDQFVAAAQPVSDKDSESRSSSRSSAADESDSDASSSKPPTAAQKTPFFSMFNLFEGSPTYKQRRKKTPGSSNLNPNKSGLSMQMERGRQQMRFPNYPYGPGGSLSRERMRPFGGMGDMEGDDVSAAEMFMKQARGELTGPGRNPGTWNEFSNRPRSLDLGGPQHRHTYPGPPMEGSPNLEGPLHANTLDGAQLDPTGKAFMCPLFSCGRLFKRMEHLKRHLRTHTMERPFACPMCRKRFSRSDNLGQHLRTHSREGMAGVERIPGFNGGMEGEGMDFAMGGEGGMGFGMNGGEWDGGMESGSDMDDGAYGSMPQGSGMGSMSNVGAPLGMFGEMGAGMGMAAQLPAGPSNEGFDLTVRGGNEEEGFFPGSAPNGPVGFGDYDGSWSGPGSYSSSSSASSLYEQNISMSAPSHKQAFDHANIYPVPSLLDAGGTGPIRRHRSMTPSMAREVRRPTTAGSDYDGTGRGMHFSPHPSPSPRGFHPYSRPESAHSSPSNFPLPLPHLARSDSRSSNYSTGEMQEQMRHMMNIGPASRQNSSDWGTGAGMGSGGGGEMFRTESPASFGGAGAMGDGASPPVFGGATESPAPFSTELPPVPPAGGAGFGGDVYPGGMDAPASFMNPLDMPGGPSRSGSGGFYPPH